MWVYITVFRVFATLRIFIVIMFQRGDYGTVSEVAGDMNIMFENAKKYNRADSRLYKVFN